LTADMQQPPFTIIEGRSKLVGSGQNLKHARNAEHLKMTTKMRGNILAISIYIPIGARGAFNHCLSEMDGN
jgi:hypothetical protein